MELLGTGGPCRLLRSLELAFLMFELDAILEVEVEPRFHLFFALLALVDIK